MSPLPGWKGFSRVCLEGCGGMLWRSALGGVTSVLNGRRSRVEGFHFWSSGSSCCFWRVVPLLLSDLFSYEMRRLPSCVLRGSRRSLPYRCSSIENQDMRSLQCDRFEASRCHGHPRNGACNSNSSRQVLCSVVDLCLDLPAGRVETSFTTMLCCYPNPRC